MQRHVCLLKEPNRSFNGEYVSAVNEYHTTCSAATVVVPLGKSLNYQLNDL